MFDFLFGSADLPPRGACLVWMRAVADGISALAYVGIPVAIVVFLRRRHDLEPTTRQLALLFIAFLLVGALTHAASVFTLWVPAYGAQGLIKATTALVSLATAIAIWPQVPRLLRLPSPRDLRRSNTKLAEANASLEATIAWRTHALELAQQRFELALSRSNITVSTQDTALRYTWIHNPRTRLNPEGMIGKTTEEVVPGEASSEAIELKRKAMQEGRTVTDTVAVRSAQDGTVYLEMTVSPTRDRNGAIDGIVCTEVDVTEKRLFEVRLAAMAAQLGDAYRRFDLALDDSPITVFEQDAELRYTYMHNPPVDAEVEDFVGKTDFELFSEGELNQFVAAKRRVFAEGAQQKLEVDVAIGGEPRFFSVTLEPKVDGNGAVERLVGTAVDLTERVRAEKQMRLVMRELTHRSKNLLAVVQAMARKTASLSGDIETFLAAFSARLGAMAAAHDLLVSNAWSGAELGELVRASIAQTVDPSSTQIAIEGPSLKLMPDTAQNLALAFHELTTNTVKYGALSNDSGRLEIGWRREKDGVHFRWLERGGPIVRPPERRGFGRVLLERLVGASLGGSVDLAFARDGVDCSIAFPDDRLAED